MDERTRGILRWLFSFDGCVDRRTWWLACGGWLLFACLVNTVDGDRDDPSAWASLVLLVSLWPMLAFTVRRWHDRGRSGLWSFVIFVPFVGFLFILIELGFLGTLPLNENAYLAGLAQRKAPSFPHAG